MSTLAKKHFYFSDIAGPVLGSCIAIFTEFK